MTSVLRSYALAAFAGAVLFYGDVGRAMPVCSVYVKAVGEDAPAKNRQIWQTYRRRLAEDAVMSPEWLKRRVAAYPGNGKAINRAGIMSKNNLPLVLAGKPVWDPIGYGKLRKLLCDSDNHRRFANFRDFSEWFVEVVASNPWRIGLLDIAEQARASPKTYSAFYLNRKLPAEEQMRKLAEILALDLEEVFAAAGWTLERGDFPGYLNKAVKANGPNAYILSVISRIPVGVVLDLLAGTGPPNRSMIRKLSRALRTSEHEMLREAGYLPDAGFFGTWLQVRLSARGESVQDVAFRTGIELGRFRAIFSGASPTRHEVVRIGQYLDKLGPALDEAMMFAESTPDFAEWLLNRVDPKILSTAHVNQKRLISPTREDVLYLVDIFDLPEDEALTAAGFRIFRKPIREISQPIREATLPAFSPDEKPPPRLASDWETYDRHVAELRLGSPEWITDRLALIWGTPGAFYNEIEVSGHTITQYKRGVFSPKPDTREKLIAKLSDPDYLVRSENFRTFAEWFTFYTSHNPWNLDLFDISNITGVSQELLVEYAGGRRVPTRQNMRALAAILRRPPEEALAAAGLLGTRRDFGKWLRNRIDAHGTSPEKIAEPAGVWPSTIYRIIEGSNASPALVRRLARSLGENVESALRTAGFRPEINGFGDWIARKRAQSIFSHEQFASFLGLTVKRFDQLVAGSWPTREEVIRVGDALGNRARALFEALMLPTEPTLAAWLAEHLEASGNKISDPLIDRILATGFVPDRRELLRLGDLLLVPDHEILKAGSHQPVLTQIRGRTENVVILDDGASLEEEDPSAEFRQVAEEARVAEEKPVPEEKQLAEAKRLAEERRKREEASKQHRQKREQAARDQELALKRKKEREEAAAREEMRSEEAQQRREVANERQKEKREDLLPKLAREKAKEDLEARAAAIRIARPDSGVTDSRSELWSAYFLKALGAQEFSPDWIDYRIRSSTLGVSAIARRLKIEPDVLEQWRAGSQVPGREYEPELRQVLLDPELQIVSRDFGRPAEWIDFHFSHYPGDESFADLAQIAHIAIVRLESLRIGELEPTIDEMSAIARALGRSEFGIFSAAGMTGDPSTFGSLLRQRLETRDFDAAKLAQMTGIAEKILLQIIDGTRYPSRAEVHAIVFWIDAPFRPAPNESGDELWNLFEPEAPFFTAGYLPLKDGFAHWLETQMARTQIAVTALASQTDISPTRIQNLLKGAPPDREEVIRFGIHFDRRTRALQAAGMKRSADRFREWFKKHHELVGVLADTLFSQTSGIDRTIIEAIRRNGYVSSREIVMRLAILFRVSYAEALDAAGYESWVAGISYPSGFNPPTFAPPGS